GRRSYPGQRIKWIRELETRKPPRQRSGSMTQVTLQEAQAKLADLVAAAVQGEEVVITQENQPSVRLVPMPTPTRPRPQFGSAKGTILYMAPDLNAPLEDFEEYM